MNETELRWRLRQLPDEIDPPRDLWPAIESRLQRPARVRPWLAGLALAASVSLGVALAWQLRGPVPAAPAAGEAVAVTPVAPADAGAPTAAAGSAAPVALLQREAEAMAREYDAALREFAGAPVPDPLVPALATLDASAVEIRAAIERDPGAVFLLDRLRSTYARRLSLTQRAATG